jgi:hypothetical protein
MYKPNWFERLLCKLGIHDEWYDSVGHNIGTDETPIYYMETVVKCHRCEWRNPRAE